MPRRCTRLFALLCCTALLASCDKEPFSPDADPSLAAAPGNPASLTATAVSPTQIDLAWRDMSTREDGFEMHRALGRSGAFSLLITMAPDMTTLGDAPLTAETEYCYKVRSFRVTGRKTTYSGFSNTACATTQSVPPPPPGPTAASEVDVRPVDNHTATAQVTWKDNSSDEGGFRVQRSSSEQGPWEVAAALSANNTSLYDYNRPLEQRLCYRVIAFRGQAESASNVDCTYLPAAATLLTITGISGQAVDLAWTDNSAVEEGFDIERSDAEWGPFTSVGTTAADVKTFRDVSVGLDKTYWYRVRVMRDGARTGSTNTVKAVTASSAPAAPSALYVVPSGSTAVVAYWTDNSANEVGFRLERSDNGGASWVQVGITPYSGLFDGGRASDQQVCYRAMAFNAVGDSPPSSVDCTAPPAAPTNLMATTVPGLAIDLTWSDNSTVEDGYVVQRLFDDCYGYYYCYPYYATIATLAPNVTSYRDAGLNPGKWHAYLVFAIKDDGYSDGSNEAGAWSDIFPAPTNLTAAAVSRTQIDLAWSDNSDEDYFIVYRCTGSAAACAGGGFVELIWLGSNVTTFSDTSVPPNSTYTYQIFAYRGRYSDGSNRASATTPP
jgi:hypothetical protein